MGILGFGRIGQAVARRALRVRYAHGLLRHLPSSPGRWRTKFGAEGTGTSTTCWAEADFVSGPHQPDAGGRTTCSTPGRLAQMKPTAVLVNTSRGPVIDEAALAEALREGDDLRRRTRRHRPGRRPDLRVCGKASVPRRPATPRGRSRAVRPGPRDRRRSAARPRPGCRRRSKPAQVTSDCSSSGPFATNTPWRLSSARYARSEPGGHRAPRPAFRRVGRAAQQDQREDVEFVRDVRSRGMGRQDIARSCRPVGQGVAVAAVGVRFPTSWKTVFRPSAAKTRMTPWPSLF